MAKLWHRYFREWPLWLRLWHITTGVLTATVMVRLVLRDFDFDTWTYLWIIYACAYGSFLDWWTREPEEGDSGKAEASWFF